ncbi:unnamed protein product [Macrosiphum euphorbiae]|uniref:DDE Tnp4 domain-containing protein n=2 Tax=Macrosiphum euphorbiae TaxID=13131 RepID=A0AAV0XS15_9HEMI|nr:unnamed protein product [Macrosiphum euphorbiae]
MVGYNYYNYNTEVHRRKVLLVYLYMLHKKKRKQRSKPRWYIKPFLKERRVHGHCHCLTNEQQLSNSALYQNFMRMSSTTFEELTCIIGIKIKRIPSRPDVLSVGEILSATLRYLASGESMTSIMFSFRIGQSTVSNLILQCCTVLWDTLSPKVLLMPDTNKWAQLAKEFENKWQMPNCLGSIDGKHIVHQAFANTGSTNFNYKGSHSIILLAMCDASYNFTVVDIGAPGRCSDGGVFSSSEMGKGFLNKTLSFPIEKEIDNKSGPIPYYAVGDEAFPLLENLMRPYPGRGKKRLPLNESIFNYRLSRSRRTIENTFGIMSSKWRVFRKPIIAGEKNSYCNYKSRGCTA